MGVGKKCGKRFGNEWWDGFGKGNEQFVFVWEIFSAQKRLFFADLEDFGSKTDFLKC